MSGGINASATPGLNKPFGFLDIIGHSHVADGGASIPDQGASHKIDGLLNPAMYRQAALGGALCSWHNAGNGQIGDGGWATVATEYDRQEQVAGYGMTTISGTGPAAGATTFTVTSAANIVGSTYYAVGQGANLEVVLVKSVAGTTITLTNPLQNGHAAGDPFYWSCVNQGYLAKSELVLCGYGINDTGALGPYNGGVFGVNIGASRGYVPLQNAYRFCLAVMRCSVIYWDTHPTCIYSGAWTSAAATSTMSYPPTYTFGGGNTGNYHYTNTVGNSVTFSTEPNFPGGTVDVFFICPTNGNGGQWNITVTGATTVSYTPALDTRNINAVRMNDSGGLTTGKVTPAVFRIKGLSPGVNTITVTANALTGQGSFLGWGIEAPSPPLIFCLLDPRCLSYATWGAWGYGTRAPVDSSGNSTQTATVAAGAGTAANSVSLGTGVSAVLPGVSGTTAVQPNDTITIGTGATQETRRVTSVGFQATVNGAGQVISTTPSTLIVNSTAGFPASGTLNITGVTSAGNASYTGITATSFTGVTIPSGSQTATNGGLITQGNATTLSVDANFQWVHTGEVCTIGMQDADVVGGGYINVADTQGAISVPGMQASLLSVINEFDYAVQPINIDAILNGGRGSSAKYASNFIGDLVHYNDQGHALVASAIYQKLISLPWPIKNMATPAVGTKKTWFGVYNDLNVTPVSNQSPGFTNNWSNVFSINNAYPRTGFYKDMRTRTVYLRGAVYNQTINTALNLPSQMFVMPLGYRPSAPMIISAWCQNGPVLVEVFPNGAVYCSAGYLGGTSSPTSNINIMEFYGSYLAEA